ncbi:MAG: RNA methyltransferase [Bacteroidetes bacterium HGW-Bacteroidetes-8]|nr:MAG: RNA methyltransferase [Bacteroidetes bacterium HGW-Bacteroidetes-8]
MYRKLDNSELKRATLQEFREGKKLPFIVVLDNVRSQHNIGSAFRSADAFAAEMLILCGICATPPSAEIRKAALGAEESVIWRYHTNTLDAVKELRGQGYRIVSVEQTENSTSLEQFSPQAGEKYAFIFGNEIKGVAQEVVDISDLTIEIPQFGSKHSLNVSVSVGVVLWEVAMAIQKQTK